MADTMPELVLVAETDPAAARRARRLAGGGVLKRLYPSIYTSNVGSPPESIVLRHWQAIVGHLLPGGVISHRSAFDSRPFEGSLSITRGKTRRDVRLPGLTIHICHKIPHSVADAIFSRTHQITDDDCRGNSKDPGLVQEPPVPGGAMSLHVVQYDQP